MSRYRAGLLLFPDVEALDFCGPYEVFSVARLNEARRRDGSGRPAEGPGGGDGDTV